MTTVFQADAFQVDSFQIDTSTPTTEGALKIDAASKSIVDAWNTAWAAIYGDPASVPYALDDEQFAEPNPPTAWVRFAIRHAVGAVMTMGRPARYKRQGVIMVQIFSPIDQGRNALDVLTKQTIDSLEAQTIGALSDCVTTYAASPREAPTNGQWAQMMVSVPFDYYETK